VDRDRLKTLIEASVHKGEVTLASGKKSDFYVDGRLVTLSAEGSRLIGEEVLDLIQELGVTAVAGPTTGACPMVSAAGVLAAQSGVPLKLAYVRAAPKGHGMQKSIEGPALGAGDTVLMVDDVMTSGGSMVRAIERLQEETGAKVVCAFCLVDRQAGGQEALDAAGVPFRALFTRADLQTAKA
jgi:orotate phosphoribosyltransferase